MNDSEQTVKIWLDAKRGTCLKILNTGINSNGEQYEMTNEYTATYGIVTDEDVKKPDLTGYTMIEENSNSDLEEPADNIVIDDDSNISNN